VRPLISRPEVSGESERPLSRRHVVAGAWLLPGVALAGLLVTAPTIPGGWWRVVAFVSVTVATWVAAGAIRWPWLLPVAVVVDGLLGQSPLHGNAFSAGLIPGPVWLALLAATPGLVRAWRRSMPPTVGMVASGAMVGGGHLVLAVAEVYVPLAPSWGSSWLALLVPVVVATAGLKRGMIIVAVLVAEPLVSTLVGSLTASDLAPPLQLSELLLWGAALAGNLAAVAVVVLIAVGIDRSLAVEPRGVGLLIALNVVNVIDAVSTWLLLMRGQALELNPLMDHPAALVAKVIGVAAASVWLRRHRPVALVIPLVPLAWVTLYHLAGWLRWAA